MTMTASEFLACSVIGILFALLLFFMVCASPEAAWGL